MSVNEIRVGRYTNRDGDTIYTVRLPRNPGNVQKGSGYRMGELVKWAQGWAPTATVVRDF